MYVNVGKYSSPMGHFAEIFGSLLSVIHGIVDLHHLHGILTINGSAPGIMESLSIGILLHESLILQ